MDLKGLQRFLGILNYAINYIPNLSKLTGPINNKCSMKGEKKFNKQDWDLVKSIKQKVQTPPPLELPEEDSHIII